MIGLGELRSAARDALHDLGSHVYCSHDVPLALRRVRGEPGERPHSDGRSPRWDAGDSDDDPYGYERLRAFLNAVADAFDEDDRPETARSLREIVGSASLPSEWIGDSALLIRAELATPDMPDSIRPELERCLASIRQGFIRTGRPNF